MVRVRLTQEQLEGIFATGSAACAESTSVEAPIGDVSARVESMLAELPNARIGRTETGAFLADCSGPLFVEEWIATVETFGPRTHVGFRAARMLRAPVILLGWLGFAPAFGVGLAAASISAFRNPGFAPGLAFVVGLTVGILALQRIANRAAERWNGEAAARMMGMTTDVGTLQRPGTYRA